MMKRLLSLALAAILLTALIPTFAVADVGGWTMYVYTEDGGTLNVRSSPKREITRWASWITASLCGYIPSAPTAGPASNGKAITASSSPATS